MAKHIKTLVLEPIAATLKTARVRKGLSQRALSEKVGVPQSHLSKIENGEVDLQTSSLIEIARALDLELTLVPRTLLPAVRALQPAQTSSTDHVFSPSLRKQLDSLSEQASRPPFHSKIKTLRILTDTIKDLRHLPLQPSDQNRIYPLLDQARTQLARLHATKAPITHEQLQRLDPMVRELRALRNVLVHGGRSSAPPQPAYRLDEESEDA